MANTPSPILSVICPTLESPVAYLDRLEKIIEDSLESASRVYEFYTANLFEIIFVVPPSFTWVEIRRPYSIRVFQDLGIGIYQALNIGIKNALGDKIVIINIDDWGNLYDLVQVCLRNSSNSQELFYGDTLLNSGSGYIYEIRGTTISDTIDLARMPGSHQAQIINKSMYIKLGYFYSKIRVGIFDLKLKYASDFEFYCRTVSTGATWVYDDNILLNQMIGGATTRHWLRTSMEIYLISFKYGSKTPRHLSFLLKCFLGAIYFHHFKRYLHLIRKGK